MSSWQSGEGTWRTADSGPPLSGDTASDGPAGVVIMYNYANGANSAHTFY